jgi:hypothetical protein
MDNRINIYLDIYVTGLQYGRLYTESVIDLFTVVTAFTCVPPIPGDEVVIPASVLHGTLVPIDRLSNNRNEP